jgi:hypothetical protein
MMARSSKAPSIGRIQMRKTNFPNYHFRLATRGRSIQMGQEETKPGAKTRSLTPHRAGYKPYFARCCYPDRHRGHDTAGDGQNKSQLVAARRIVNDACYPGPHCTPPISATVIVPKIDP